MTEPIFRDITSLVKNPEALRALDKATDGSAAWSNLSADQRNGLCALVAETLERLIRDPAEWVPKAVVVDEDESLIGIFVLWRLTDVNFQVLQLREDVKRQEADAIAELQRLAGGRAEDS